MSVLHFVRTQAPAVLPVELREAAGNLGVDGTDSDSKIESWVRGVTATLEHRIGQSLMRQVWTGLLPQFSAEIALPHPVLEVLKVEYVDPAGVDQVLPPSAVRVKAGQYASFLKPARGATWPATLADEEAVRITVACGYGDTPADTPEDLRLYILAKLVEQFDPAAGGERETVQTSYLDSMLHHYRSFQ